MDDHTVKSLVAALRGMPPDAPILVNVGGRLRPVSLVRPAWVAAGVEDSTATKDAKYAVVLTIASD